MQSRRYVTNGTITRNILQYMWPYSIPQVCIGGIGGEGVCMLGVRWAVFLCARAVCVRAARRPFRSPVSKHTEQTNKTKPPSIHPRPHLHSSTDTNPCVCLPSNPPPSPLPFPSFPFPHLPFPSPPFLSLSSFPIPYPPPPPLSPLSFPIVHRSPSYGHRHTTVQNPSSSPPHRRRNGP